MPSILMETSLHDISSLGLFNMWHVECMPKKDITENEECTQMIRMISFMWGESRTKKMKKNISCSQGH